VWDKKKNSGFHAMLSRMKYIPRWSLMRCSRTESLSEHTTETAQIAYTLCCTDRQLFGGDVRPDKVAVAALFHDASEIITGDMPTPVKYRNPQLRDAYKKIEAEARTTLVALLPPQLQPVMAPALLGQELTERERTLLKAADRLSALIKCIEEQQSGNPEFASAYAQQLAALEKMDCPAAAWFVETMLPGYRLTLDELTAAAEKQEPPV